MVLPFYNVGEVFDFAFIDGGDEAHRIPVPFPFSPVVFLSVSGQTVQESAMTVALIALFLLY